MGTPTLAVSHDYATGVDEGYTDYIMGPQGLPIEDLVFGTGTPQWYYQDIQGNTRVLLNSTGGLIGSQNYPPFGVATSSWNGGTLGTPLQYNGAYSDGWTGFVYDQARWYDPGTGQFLSQDPLVDQTLQAYTYGADNPGGNNDTSGLSKRKGRMKTKFHVCANDYGDPNQGSNSTNMPNEWKAALCVNISYFHGGVQFHYNTGLTYYLNCWNGGDPTATCDYKDARVNQGWIRGHKIVEDSQPAYYTDFVVTWHFTILLTIEAWANGGVKKQATTQLQGGYPGPVPLPFL
jgi:RHS repeat-associated protein